MKRKLLLEFADWLEKSRVPFYIGNARQCVSFQACRFNGDVKRGVTRVSTSLDLIRIFDLSYSQASNLYSGFDWDNAKKITRKVAANVVRRLARTGRVDWQKAIEA